MKGPQENSSSHPGDSRLGSKTPMAAPPPANPATSPPPISVRCPNPKCGKTYTIPGDSVGKQARCPCGAVFVIPNISAAHPADHPAPTQERTATPAASRAPRVESQAAPRVESQAPPRVESQAPPRVEARAAPCEEATVREGEDVTEVRVGCIGRGNAGKTALLRALSEGPVGDFFPSGLHVDAGDPREVAQMIRETEEAQRLLHQSGLPPTLQASQVRYFLFEGDRQRVVYKMHEVIGQILTHTLPNSAADQQTRYAQYLRGLLDTHVLWAVVPCQPANPNAHDRRRYTNDLRITLAYLREALRLRSVGQPVAVALVLSKIDTPFQDAEEAQASLTDEVLRTSFGPLVHLIEQSPRVSDAVVIPVTTFGFGNAVLREENVGRDGSAEKDDPFTSEPNWLLKEGISAQAYNLDTLFLWTLLFGLVNQAGEGPAEGNKGLAHIRRTLWDDLGAIDPWLLPVKEGVAGEGRRASQIVGVR